jgi:hypothetical protein
MQNIVVAAAALALTAGVALAQDAVAGPAGGPDQAPAGFTALFDGETLDGWWGMGTEDPRPWLAMSKEDRARKIAASQDDIHAHWRVEDGQLVNDGHGLYLTTAKDYADFELLVDYRTVAKADSGIYLRGIPQVQIWDYTEAGGKWSIGADKGSGGLWNNSAGAPGKDPRVLADRPFGEWNRFRIRMIGSYVTVWLNGALVVADAVLENYFDRGSPVPRTGPIQLQTHGGEIRWRNVYLREIPAEEANEYLRGLGGVAMKPVFNGVDLSGWGGPVDNYEVLDGGVLRCKAHRGGTIYTEQEYGDFVADLEIRLPAGGNNGLAIRYPGEGDTAYVGMCELQVLDDGAPKYGSLDPRQYHGSAYGMAAARRGYQRPVGEWNFERVTVRGSTIVVELNGFEILNADLSTITDFMANSAHPGKDRRKGHFGFAGHSDPVEFRKVRVGTLGPDADRR